MSQDTQPEPSGAATQKAARVSTVVPRRRRWLRLIGWAAATLSAFLAVCAVISLVMTHRAEERFPRTGKFVEAEGLRLHYIERGAPVRGEPTVVLVHGAFSALQDWEATVLGDLAERHHVIAFDRPGHGYSERPDEVATPAVQARILHAALRAIGVERAMFVGFSWGGTVAVAHGIAYPDDTAGLVTINAPLYDWKGHTSVLYKAGRISVLGPLLAHTVVSPFGTLMANASIKKAFAPGDVPEAFARSPVALSLRPSGYLANAEDMAILQGFLQGQAQHYREIEIPTVVVAGKDDQTAWATVHSIPFVEAAPGAELVLVEGGGHQLPYTHPQLVIYAVEHVLEYSK